MIGIIVVNIDKGEKMNYMHSSEKIKGLRIHKGYTVEQLAEEANIYL